MTAVEWLEKELKDRYALMNSEPLFQQALEMEKQQRQKVDKFGKCFDEIDMKKAFNEGQKELSNNTDFDVLINTYR